MPITTLQQFIGFLPSYQNYLQNQLDVLGQTAINEVTRQIMPMSTYYNNDGSFNKFGATPDDTAYYDVGGGNFTKLNITNSTLLRIAGTAYCESANVLSCIMFIPFATFNKLYREKKSKYKCYNDPWNVNNTLVLIRNRQNDNQYYHYKYSQLFVNFMEAKISQRTNNMNASIEYSARASIYYDHIIIGTTSPFPDLANGGIGWDGIDFHLKGGGGYRDRYLNGFHFQAGANPFNQQDHNNKGNLGNHVVNATGATDSQKIKAIHDLFDLLPFEFQSTAGGGTMSQGSICYQPHPDFVAAYQHSAVIGAGYFGQGVLPYGGQCNASDKRKDPDIIKPPYLPYKP